jgi:chromosome segregation ATPase
MNEAVYRSPNWLKKVLDFELHTGEDIKGKVSKKEMREKAAEEASRAAEREAEESDRKKREAEEEQSRIKSELDNLFQDMIRDFSNNPYSDKYHTKTVDGLTTFHYTFENGNTISIGDDNTIRYENVTYTVSTTYRSKFIKLANEIIDKGRSRPSGYGGKKSGGRYYGGSSKAKSNKYASHPKGNVYETIKDTIKSREDQLKKMSKTDPERVSLQNELDAAKRRLKEMQDKYKFENLVGFWDFKY